MTKIQYSIDVKAKQVCVEPRPSTLYVTLSEFAAERLRPQQISIDYTYFV